MKWLSAPALTLCIVLAGCGNTATPPLKVLGEKVVHHYTVGGKVVNDTISSTIPPFKFLDQYGHQIDTSTISGKIYVVDFFFTHCPGICPKMKAEMLRVHDRFRDKDIMYLSHSIDPERDSFPVLKSYSEKLNLTDRKWLFLTGDRDSIYSIADRYLAYAKEDKDAPGGFVHDGNFILIDKQRRIRGYYDGTTDIGTDKLIADMEKLLDEK